MEQEISKEVNQGLSENTKTLIVILLLIFAYPVGIILMLVWMKWPWWIKLLVALPTTLVFLAILGIMSVAMLASINPSGQIAKAKDTMYRNESAQILSAATVYYAKNGTMPWGGTVEEKYVTNDLAAEAWTAKLESDGELKPGFWDKMKADNTIFRLNKPAGSQDFTICFGSKATPNQEICTPQL